MTIIGMHTVTLFLVVFSQAFTFSPGRSVMQHTPASQTTVVLAQSQPDSPLQISAVTNHSPDSKKLNITFVVWNITDKAIRAYATKHEPVCFEGKDQGMGILLSNHVSADRLFLPGQSRSEEIAGRSSSTPFQKVTLSIDFVEFTDGSRWGPDVAKFSEQLDGMRAGMKAAKTELLKLLSEKGPEAIVELLESDMHLLAPERKHSGLWVTGFRLGVKGMSARLLQAYKDKGIAEIEKGLKEPIDASEDK
jgi:hypothetical protein